MFRDLILAPWISSTCAPEVADLRMRFTVQIWMRRALFVVPTKTKESTATVGKSSSRGEGHPGVEPAPEPFDAIDV